MRAIRVTNYELKRALPAIAPSEISSSDLFGV